MSWLSSISGGLLRRFTACGREDYREASIEVLTICISAFLPLWAGMGFFAMINIVGSVRKYGSSFLTSGEMILIGCAMIGPLIYIVTKKYGRLTDPLTLRFPYSTGFSLVVVLIWFIVGGIFVAIKGNELFGAALLNEGAMRVASLTITAIVITLLYFATVFRNFMDRVDPGRLMHDEQEKFVQEFGDAGTH